MNHYDRMKTVFELGIPDRVPTFELEFQLEEEFMGKKFLVWDDIKNMSPKEREKAIIEDAEYMIRVYSALEYDAFNCGYIGNFDEGQLGYFTDVYAQHVKALRAAGGEEFMMFTHGDGTFAIPDGKGMMELAFRIADDPDDVHAEADRRCREAIERCKHMRDLGITCFLMPDDYCFNQGPFLSPTMFREFITPYMSRIIQAIRDMGCYAIKHTDGNIMPILDQLLEARPHAIHSLDPMAGVDIAEVKKRTFGKTAICGNVNCALLQTGTEEEIRESARYALKHGKPGGGYVYCTSNVPFMGLPLDRYMICLDEWKKARDY